MDNFLRVTASSGKDTVQSEREREGILIIHSSTVTKQQDESPTVYEI